MKNKLYYQHFFIFVIGIGTTFFVINLLFGGLYPIFPSNYEWLAAGDSAAYYLCSVYFAADEWRWPLGLNPNYGEGFNASIAQCSPSFLFSLTDKLFTHWGLTDYEHQHFGIMIAVNIFLQFITSYAIVRKFFDGNVVIVPMLASILFVQMSQFLLRNTGHYDLGAHYLILAGIYVLFFERKRIHFYFFLICLIAVLTHPYIFAMTSILYFSGAVFRSLDEINLQSKNRITVIVQNIGFFSLSICVVILLYYLLTGTSNETSIKAVGYGFYRADLLTFIDGGGSLFTGDIPSEPGEYEGSFYLGIGFLLIIIIGIITYALKGFDTAYINKQKILTISFFLLGSYIFAVSNNISIGTFVYTIQSSWWEYIGSYFRASGRFVWPLGYLICFGVLWYLIRVFEKRTIIVALIVACFFQVAETMTWFKAQPERSWSKDYVNEFKLLRQSDIRGIRTFSPGFQYTNQEFLKLAFAASKENLSIDQYYVARFDTHRANELRHQRFDSFFDKNNLNPDYAYIIPPSMLPSVLMKGEHYFYKISDLVFATKKNIIGLSQAEFPPQLSFFDRQLSGDSFNIFLGKGWHQIEGWGGVWTSSTHALIRIPSGIGSISSIILELTPLGAEANPKVDQMINVECPGGKISERPRDSFFVCDTSGYLGHFISIRIDKIYSPKDLGINTDTRQLGVALRSITILN